MLNKLDGIQALRGYAAILVVVTHLWSTGRISGFFGFARVGGFGVDIFFIISGFIMCYSLKNDIRPSDSINFLKKRIYRLYPIYLLILIPFVLAYLFGDSIAVADPEFIIGNALLLPSFWGGSSYHMLIGPTWTLVYEMFFYFLFACSMLSSRSKNRAIYIVIATIVTMIGCVNAFGLKGQRLGWVNFQYMIGDPLLLNFVLGCFCYLFWRKYHRIIFGFYFAIISLFIFTAIAMFLSHTGPARFVSLGLPACGVVLIFLFTEFNSAKLSKIFIFLGAASYSIYLVHALLEKWKYLIVGAGIRENDISGILFTIIAILAGCVFYIFIEKPISAALHKHADRNIIISPAKA